MYESRNKPFGLIIIFFLFCRLYKVFLSGSLSFNYFMWCKIFNFTVFNSFFLGIILALTSESSDLIEPFKHAVTNVKHQTGEWMNTASGVDTVQWSDGGKLQQLEDSVIPYYFKSFGYRCAKPSNREQVGHIVDGIALQSLLTFSNVKRTCY